MNKLKHYRLKIDEIDRQIARLLSARFELAKKIAIYKKLNKLKIVDKKREVQVIKNINRHSNKHQKFLKEIFGDILSYSRKIQK